MLAERRAALYDGWREAMARTLFAPQTQNETLTNDTDEHGRSPFSSSVFSV